MSSQKGYTIEDPYASYFLTFTLVGWVDLFTRKALRDIVIGSLKYCQEKKGLIIHAYVVMSSHLHLMVTAAEGSAGLPAIIRDFKKYTSKAMVAWIKDNKQESRRDWLEVVFKYHARYCKQTVNYKVWQGGNQPKVLLHPKFTAQKLDYIHYNPVEAGLVARPEDYLYSSARAYAGLDGNLLDVSIIDFGVQEGYVFT